MSRSFPERLHEFLNIHSLLCRAPARVINSQTFGEKAVYEMRRAYFDRLQRRAARTTNVQVRCLPGELTVTEKLHFAGASEFID